MTTATYNVIWQGFGIYSAGAYARGATSTPPPLSQPTQPPPQPPPTDYVDTPPAKPVSVAPWDRHVTPKSTPTPPPAVSTEQAPAPPVSQPANQPPPQPAPRSTDNG